MSTSRRRNTVILDTLCHKIGRRNSKNEGKGEYGQWKGERNWFGPEKEPKPFKVLATSLETIYFKTTGYYYI